MIEPHVQIGVLSPGTPHGPHFKSLEAILPSGVTMVHEGLGMLGDSYQDLSGKFDRVIEAAKSFVRRHDASGIMLTGGFMTLFNPGLDAKVSAATGKAVASAVSSATAALTAFKARAVLLMTPFDAASDRVIEAHLESLRFTVYLGPSFESRKAGSPVELSADQLFELVEKTYRSNPSAQAIYFQGATMDPLPIIRQLEAELNVPVVTSNSAMVWRSLSVLGLKYSVENYGELLKIWPSLR
jgi:maleate cis-trans isomerase